MVKILALIATLHATGGGALQPTPSPYEGEWIVETIDNVRVMPESRVTMRIEGRTISGLASCNTYRGSFTVENGVVRVGEFLKTMKACDPPRMAEESDFTALMREVARYELRPDDRLVLVTDEGKTIVARKP